MGDTIRGLGPERFWQRLVTSIMCTQQYQNGNPHKDIIRRESILAFSFWRAMARSRCTLITRLKFRSFVVLTRIPDTIILILEHKYEITSMWCSRTTAATHTETRGTSLSQCKQPATFLRKGQYQVSRLRGRSNSLQYRFPTLPDFLWSVPSTVDGLCAVVPFSCAILS